MAAKEDSPLGSGRFRDRADCGGGVASLCRCPIAPIIVTTPDRGPITITTSTGEIGCQSPGGQG